MIDQALQGMNIAVLTDAGRLSSYVHDMGIMNMAYFVNKYDDGCKVMETETFKGWDEALAQEGLRGLCYNYYDGARSFCGHAPWTKPEDLKGVVIRTPGAAPYSKSIEALGATAYNIGWGEVYNGIQTKAIDGCEAQFTSLVSSKIYEVCEIEKGAKVVVVEDLISTGGSSLKAVAALREYGVEVIGMVASFTYGFPVAEKAFEEAGVKLITLSNYDAVVEEAAKTAYEQLGWTELREQLYKEAGIA